MHVSACQQQEAPKQGTVALSKDFVATLKKHLSCLTSQVRDLIKVQDFRWSGSGMRLTLLTLQFQMALQMTTGSLHLWPQAQLSFIPLHDSEVMCTQLAP